MNENANIIGLMSGTSLDGLDIACCSFSQQMNKTSHNIIACDTIPYDIEWKNKLKHAPLLSGYDLTVLNYDFGQWIAAQVCAFTKKHKIQSGIVASHGHTVFHEPEKNLTLQIGSGSAISSHSGMDVICDFRSQDVLLGGQGAPLVPAGEFLLFPDFDFFINLGGFANISYKQKNQIIAYDICPVNIALNHFSSFFKKEFDQDGLIAKSGHVDQSLLTKLNNIKYYQKKPPKSLGREWFEKQFLNHMKDISISAKDILATITEHVAKQIADNINRNNSSKKGMITGGGALNSFLITRIKSYLKDTKIMIPERQIIHYKEALIFAFLAWLFIKNKPNVLSSVTGSKRDIIAGSYFKGWKY